MVLFFFIFRKIDVLYCVSILFVKMMKFGNGVSIFVYVGILGI